MRKTHVRGKVYRPENVAPRQQRSPTGARTHQDAVEGGRRASSLDVAQDGHARVEAQALDNKLVARELRDNNNNNNNKRLGKCLMIDG